MKIRKTLRNIALLGLFGLSTVACDDFLTITPTNDIILEEYWTEKADVDAAVASVYKSLLKDGIIERMIVWGELRSDNMTVGLIESSDEYLRSVANNNMYASNGINGWGDFYHVINNCNTVLKYAPEVQAKDPNFLEGDLEVIESEMRTIRALCYFYLLRSFHAIPVNTVNVMDDADVREPEQVSRDSIYTLILEDLNYAEPLAVESGAYVSDEQNKGYITRDAVRAIRADVYLWLASEKGDKAAYQQCVNDCDLVIDSKVLAYNKNIKNASLSAGVKEEADVSLGIYPLVSNDGIGVGSINLTENAYYDLWGSENGEESIFELQFDGDASNGDQNVNNKSYQLHGCDESNIGKLAPAAFLSENYAAKAPGLQDPLFSAKDVRRYENIYTRSAGEYGIAKYASRLAIPISVATTTGEVTAQYNYRSGEGKNDANWIVYRLTDVMLMKAEALVQINDSLGAFRLVNAIHKRATPSATISDTLSYDEYKNNMEKLVLDERQRELMFEGKRWYDLMRYALRRNSSKEMVNAFLLQKYEDNQAAIKSKLSNLNSLFFPIAQSELDRNKNLKQNPEFLTTSSTERN